MELTFFQKNLTGAEEKAFGELLEEKIDGIESLLTKFADDAAILKVSVRKFEKHDAYSVEFCLNLPTKSIVAKEVSHKMGKAMELAKSRTISQIKKHMSILRKEREHSTIREGAGKVETPVEQFLRA